MLNPAFTGTTPQMSFNTNFKRSGVPTSESYLELLQATFTYPFNRTTSKDHQVGGAGVTFLRERRGFQGVYTAQKILLNGAYTLKLDKLSNRAFVFGLQGGIVQNRIVGDNLEWGSQFSRYIGFDSSGPVEIVNSDPIIYPVFNVGVIFSSFDNDNPLVRDQSILVGVSVDNLNEPTVAQEGFGVTERKRLFKGFGSAKFELAPRFSVHPSAYVLFSSGESQINGGLYISSLVSAPRAFNALLLQIGTWYRLNDSIIVLGGFQLNNLRLGVSLDLNAQSFDINKALDRNLPSYEISLTYNLDLSDPLRHVSSPIF